MTMKITKGMRETAAATGLGKRSMWSTESYFKLVEAGLATLEHPEDYADPSAYKLTREGAELANDEIRKAAEARVRKNTSSRTRHAVMTGLGMRRTRGGGYE